MKKLIALLLSLVMVFGLVACGEAGNETTEAPADGTTAAPAADDTTAAPADEGGTIAVIAKGETHAFWQAVKAGAEAAGKEAGYDVTFRGPTAESEEYVGSQREMVQAALNNDDVKGIVLATIGLGFADELTAAYDKGLPVVEFDSGLYEGGADITEGKDPTIGSVATNNKMAAALVAENFYAYLKAQNVLVDGYKIGVIQHDSTSTGIDRAEGFIEKIEELAKADNITLAINRQVKANNAGTNHYDLIKDAGANSSLLVGSVAQDSYAIGYEAVKLAIAELKGETVEDVGIAGQWYTAENIDELKEQNIFYMG